MSTRYKQPLMHQFTAFTSSSFFAPPQQWLQHFYEKLKTRLNTSLSYPHLPNSTLPKQLILLLLSPAHPPLSIPTYFVQTNPSSCNRLFDGPLAFTQQTERSIISISLIPPLSSSLACHGSPVPFRRSLNYFSKFLLV